MMVPGRAKGGMRWTRRDKQKRWSLGAEGLVMTVRVRTEAEPKERRGGGMSRS